MTEEQEANLSMFMRVVELFRKSEGKVEVPEEIKEQLRELQSNVAQIIELLNDEERDSMLERYKDDLEYFNNIKNKK